MKHDERAQGARTHTHVLQIFLLQQHMRFLYARVQPVLPGISPIYIHVWSISCSTNRLRRWCRQRDGARRRMKGEEEERGAPGERARKEVGGGGAENMQRGSADEMRSKGGQAGCRWKGGE